MNEQLPPGTTTRDSPRFFFGWYIVAASVLTNTLTTAAYFQGFQAFFLPILNTFGWSRTAISGAFSLRQVESGLMSPVVGLLTDRLTPRVLIIAGSVVMGLGLVGLSQTRNLPMFYIFFIVASVGTAGTSHGVTWAVIISRWFVRRRGRAMGIATLGPTFGTLFVVINTILVTQFGWRWVLFGYGIVVGGGGSALGMFARPYPEEYGYLPDGADPRSQGALEGATHAIGQGPRPRTQGLSPGEVLRTPDFWVITLFLTSAFVGTSALQAHQLAYFASKGFSTSSAAITVLVAGLASGIGRIGAGTLVDLVDYRLVLAMVTVLLGVSFLYLAIVPVGGLATALPFALLFGVGWGSSVPVRPIVGGFTFGNKSLGAVVGFMHFGSLAGGVVGPLLMGYIFDTQGTYDSAIWILAVITLSTLPVLLYLKPRSKLPLSRTPRRTADDALPAANENSD